MRIGVPKEIKPQEGRVGLVPAGVRQLVAAGHEVMVQSGAGEGSGLLDEEYVEAGATLIDDADELWGRAEMVWKVKEPVAEEYPRLQKDQILYTYLHLAAEPALTRALVEAGTVAIAYETIGGPDGRLPLLAPMSEVAGRLSVQAGARCLERAMGGRGVLLGGVPGVPPGRVIVIGGGVVGRNAVRMAVGMGADVTLIDVNMDVLRWFDDSYKGRVRTLFSTAYTIEAAVVDADLLIGAVLVPGARAPRLVRREHIEAMQPGAAVVDVAVDQGGCIETIHPTTHGDPTYLVEGVVHYGVSNMPGAVPRTSTFALHNATFPYGTRLADLGWKDALAADPDLARGLNVAEGRVTYRAVAEAHDLPYEPWSP